MADNNGGGSSGEATHGSNRSSSESDNLPADSAEKQCLFALKRLNLEPAPAGIFFDKNQIARGTIMAGDQQVNISSNVYNLDTQPKKVHQYHLEFSKILKEDKTRPLVEDNGGRKMPDYTVYQNRHMHRKLLSAFVQKFPNVFGQDPDNFCYDYAATLFSLIEIQAIDTMLLLEVAETQAAIERPYKVTLVIKKPADNIFDITDIMKNAGANDVATQPLHIVRFLELATSRYASQHPEDHVMYESKKTFYMDPAKYGFNSADLANGKYLAPGASKAVACVEGRNNEGAPVVVIDSKKTPFYNSMNLLEMLCTGLERSPDGIVERYHIEIINKYLKRLECFPIYGGRQEIPIALKQLCKNDALSTTIEYNGNRTTVAEYYQQRYGITLRYPHWPLVQAAKKVKGSFPTFPVELLHVADYQRVGNGNISSTDIAKIVRACAVNPHLKRIEVNNCFRSFSFGIDEFMKKAGLSVQDTPLVVPARVLKPPQIQYANGNLTPEGNGKWRLPRQAKYVRGITCHSWCGIFLNVRGERMREGDFQQFVMRYHAECRNRGLNMAEAQGVYPVDCTEMAIEEAFKLAAQDGNQFMLFCHSDRDNTMHSFIKAMERRYGVITQCVRTKTIDNVMKKSPLSLENIVAKTNIKLGGLNNQIVLDNYGVDPTVLFIGLGMNHPAGGLGMPPDAQEGNNAEKKDENGENGDSTPINFSILGFSANDGRNANEFIGNFFFQPMLRDEKLTVLDKLLIEILERFKANRGCPPSRVILFRSGCAEGAFGSVLRYEIPVIAAMIEKYAPGAPVSVVVPSKMHSVRFFNQNINPTVRSDDQNIRPGTVLDRAVVSSVYSEYYLNSHLAIQGTAKTTKYTIIYSTEKDATLDMFERWTNALCYDFQIVTSPTSLPAPVYIANRYAERGRQIFNTHSSSGKNGNGNGHESNGNGSNGHGSNGNGDPENAPNPFYTKSLEFNFTHMEFLRDKRINA